MVVLDADSVMTGDCLSGLVRLMEANPNAGIIQSSPKASGMDTLYARCQQFATRVYGPLFTAGLHFWQLGESHYWGHNAIIRVQPFIEHCALAPLPGEGSFAGSILSHDFVEAALMRRAGWGVWIAYDLPGSYEELPPNLLDELKRDRRWCHGNLMNFRLFLVKGMHPVHRAVFLTGVMSYLSAPLWFMFLALSTALQVVHALTSPEVIAPRTTGVVPSCTLLTVFTPWLSSTCKMILPSSAPSVSIFDPTFTGSAACSGRLSAASNAAEPKIPPHAALAETVEGAVAVKRPQLKGLINGVLRQFQRQQDELLAEFSRTEKRFLHPDWLLKRLQKAWPQQWEAIVEANNQRPPMWLRVNRNHHSRDEWLKLLEEAGMSAHTHPDYPDAVRLATPAPVHALPGFEEGWVTVQDASAQGCMTWLTPQNGERILDLCAAPGGKTTHILEVAPLASVMAVDIDEQRLSRVYDNLKRLGMKAEVKQGDGRTPAQWCGDTQFDRILLDAPCSATGVIRRHPDIKWLRRDRDIKELAQLQSEILDVKEGRRRSVKRGNYRDFVPVIPVESAGYA
jgi:16S rRNA C967 or C1407 C5-methylase (RsmB/RsmF family)